jgi:hypothetical protein
MSITAAVQQPAIFDAVRLLYKYTEQYTEIAEFPQLECTKAPCNRVIYS